MMTAAFGGKDSARVVNPTRRNFVKYDGKDSVEISCDEFLEVPYNEYIASLPQYESGSTSRLLRGDKT